MWDLHGSQLSLYHSVSRINCILPEGSVGSANFKLLDQDSVELRLLSQRTQAAFILALGSYCSAALAVPIGRN